ncbi:MAG: hypothetical protein ACI4U1_05060 [Anaerovoracaceae bacterium]
MTRLDKCIKLNFQMVENDIGIMCVMAGTALICVLGIITLVLSPLLAVVQVIFAVKMYKKLFYTSLYGETAAFYQSIPASAEEVAASKIFTAGTGLLMSNVISIICLIIVWNSGSIAGDLMQTLMDVADADMKSFLSAEFLILKFLALTSSLYRQSAYILMAVVIYNSFAPKRRNEWTRVLAFVIAGAGHIAISSLDDILRLAGLEANALLIPAACIALDIMLTVLFYRITVNKLETKYALS